MGAPDLRKARSLLFVPGDRPERFDKALASGAGAVIVDLEDAVAPQAKEAARANLAGWLHADRPVVVRINAGDTPWHAADLELAGRPGVAAIMLPKAASLTEIAGLHRRGAAVLPIIESAQGYAAAPDIARAPGVLRLAFGSIDFQFDLGIEGEGDPLLFFRSGLVLASRLAELPAPIDGVSTDTRDADAVHAQSRYARSLGFGAKLCIHPAQLEPVHRAFAPDQAQLAWARRVVEAAASANGGAVSVDGRMVDRPVLLKARALLAETAHSPPHP